MITLWGVIGKNRAMAAHLKADPQNNDPCNQGELSAVQIDPMFAQLKDTIP